MKFLADENAKLPTMDQLHVINKEVANEDITEIQNRVLTNVKTEQIDFKKQSKFN